MRRKWRRFVVARHGHTGFKQKQKAWAQWTAKMLHIAGGFPLVAFLPLSRLSFSAPQQFINVGDWFSYLAWPHLPQLFGFCFFFFRFFGFLGFEFQLRLNDEDDGDCFWGFGFGTKARQMARGIAIELQVMIVVGVRNGSAGVLPHWWTFRSRMNQKISGYAPPLTTTDVRYVRLGFRVAGDGIKGYLFK